MILLPAADAVLLKNDDELYADHPEFDYILLVPSKRKYFSVGSFEARVWQLIEKGFTPAQIVVRLTEETGKFEQDRVDKILHSWWDAGAIGELGATSSVKKLHWWERPWWIEISFPRVNDYLANIYRMVGRKMFNKAGLWMQGILLITGTLAWTLFNYRGGAAQLSVEEFPFALFLALSLCSLFLHELGHGLAMQWAGSKAYRGGVALYFGLPIFFVDTTPVWAKNRSKRIIVSLAGIMMNLLQASLLSIGLLFVASGSAAAVMYQLVILNIFTAALSLLPFVRMDGYYILMDLLQLPNLENSAWQVAKKIASGEVPQTRRQRLLIFFAILNVVFSLLLMVYAVYYWAGLIIRIFN